MEIAIFRHWRIIFQLFQLNFFFCFVVSNKEIKYVFCYNRFEREYITLTDWSGSAGTPNNPVDKYTLNWFLYLAFTIGQRGGGGGY